MNFLDKQKNYPRVRQAIAENLGSIQNIFKKKNVSFPPENIYIRAFKFERELELWAQSTHTDTFTYIKKYMFCSSSGKPGPKRKQGDGQIPEGFYYINRFNPASNFYLSLGINYPNASDKILGEKSHLGGDIFIHGNCVTIGCIPITDEWIKELYIIAIYTRNNGQEKIPVHIFPMKMIEENILKLQSLEPTIMPFWNNLKEGYHFFEKQHLLPKISVNKTDGRYIFN